MHEDMRCGKENVKLRSVHYFILMSANIIPKAAVQCTFGSYFGFMHVKSNEKHAY